MNTKRPFDVEVAIDRVREAVKPFPRAMLFQLYDDGHSTPFEMLVACLISVRTRDETSLAMAQNLFARARTPSEMAELVARHYEKTREVPLSDRSMNDSSAATGRVRDTGGRAGGSPSMLL